MSYNLLGNPFYEKQVTDIEDFKTQPFIPTELAKKFKKELEWSFPTSNYFIYYSILGKKGVGKTSILLFLKNVIETAKMNGRKVKVIYMNRYYEKISDDKYFILHKLLFDEFPKSRHSVENVVKKELKKYYHTYFIFDMPEEVMDNKILREFARFLDFIIRERLGSIFVGMNQSHFAKLDKITNIFGIDGKVTTCDISEDYDEELMLEIAKRRIALFREREYSGYCLYPFTEDALRLIAKWSSFIPRNFLIGCNTCLLRTNGEQIIETSSVENILKPSFANQLIESKVNDTAERKTYMKIYDCIKKDFGSSCEDRTTLLNKLNENEGNNEYVFCLSTLSIKINKMEEWGVLEVYKNFKTPRGQRIRLLI